MAHILNGPIQNVDEHSSKYGTQRYDVFAQSKDHSTNTHAKNNQKRKVRGLNVFKAYLTIRHYII